MDALRNVLTRLEKEGTALGHFNFAELVLFKAVLASAGEIKVPVLMGASEGERPKESEISLVRASLPLS